MPPLSAGPNATEAQDKAGNSNQIEKEIESSIVGFI